LGKTYGIKRGAIENTLEKHIGNLKGTCWEERENERNPPATPSNPPTQNLKGKKSRCPECMLQPTHWLHVFLVPKTVGYRFWPIPITIGTLLNLHKRTGLSFLTNNSSNIVISLLFQQQTVE
jgi:hypothetical protein